MSELSDNKLKKLLSMSSQGGFWYITKQNLFFRDLCFIAKILEEWGDSNNENYQNFFDRHKELPEFGSFPPLTAHRATKNCEYIGLIRPSDKYSSKSLTPFYYSLKELCGGDFNKLQFYPEIIDKQLERIFIDSNNRLPYTENFQICPFMFLFKILLLIGDITKSYSISTSEFKLFVATARDWTEYFEVTESILRYRSDNNFKLKCDANSNKVADVRYNVLAQNHSQLEVTKNEIAIKTNQIKNIRRKVAEYELNDTIQSAEDMFCAGSMSISESLQQIYYGAPGTGKSYEINRLTEGEEVIRTTFHPDSDYSTFVGCYKPHMEEEDKTTVIGKDLIVVKDESGQPKKEKRIVYKYSCQAFLQAYIAAWQHPDKAQYLVIEEINRGNCAQIFGDIFQLLDRNDEGYSSYPIKTDADAENELKTLFTEEWSLTEEKAKRIDDLYTKHYPEGITKSIKGGSILLLPSNLYIWATMNTSDQSLFPIDSAFKRRWDWKYMKIADGRDSETNEPLNWVVKFDFEEDKKTYTFECSWWQFIMAINEKISDATSSDDKKLGYFFCKPKTQGSKEIDAERFVGKVVFYLWNDVFKDEDNAIFKVVEGKSNPSFDAFYTEDDRGNTIVNTKALRTFMHNVFVNQSDSYTENAKETTDIAETVEE